MTCFILNVELICWSGTDYVREMTNTYLLENVKQGFCMFKHHGKNKQTLKSVFAKSGWNEFI